MATAETDAGLSSADALERATYLWEEYKYRHDLIWRLLFRVTLVATLLSIAPFTIDQLVQERSGPWVEFLPGLAMVLVAASWPVLVVEFRLFEPVDARYVELQRDALDAEMRKPKRFDAFKWIVYLYPVVLFGLTALVGCVLWL